MGQHPVAFSEVISGLTMVYGTYNNVLGIGVCKRKYADTPLRYNELVNGAYKPCNL